MRTNKNYENVAATGVGIALMYNCLMYQSLLWYTTGPATAFSASCPTVDLYIVNALMALMFSLMNIAQSIVAFEGYRQYKTRRGQAQIAFVVISHLVASLTVCTRQIVASVCASWSSI